jgi:hypothetical protein
MLGLNGVAGFFMSIALPAIYFAAHRISAEILTCLGCPHFWGTQELQVLSVLTSFFLIAVQCITCIFVKEKVLVSTMYFAYLASADVSMMLHSNDEKRGFMKELKTLVHSALTLPRVIMQL